MFDGTAIACRSPSTPPAPPTSCSSTPATRRSTFEEVSRGPGRPAAVRQLQLARRRRAAQLADNTFDDAVGGVDLTVDAASDDAGHRHVAQTDASLVDAVEDFVDAYNSLRTDLDKLTAFDPEALTTGLLFGTQRALQVDIATVAR